MPAPHASSDPLPGGNSLPNDPVGTLGAVSSPVQTLERAHQVESILDSITDAFTALDRDWRFRYVNRRYMELVAPLHATPDDLLGHVLWEKFPGLETLPIGQFYERVMAEQKPGVMEVYFEPLSAWLEAHAYPSPDLLSIYIRDVTPRRKAEDDLRQQSLRMQLLSETLAQLINARDPETLVRELFAKVAAHLEADTYFNYMVSEDGEYLSLQSSAGISDEERQSILRLEFGQAICGHVAQSHCPVIATDIQQSEDSREALVRGLGMQVYVCNPLMVAGRLLGTLSFASRTRTSFDEGELDFIRVVSHHTAVALDRLQTSKAVAASAAHLALAMAAADLGNWSWDSESDLTTMSQRAAEIYGIQAGKRYTRVALRELIHPEDRDRANLAAQKCSLTGEDYEVEYRVNRSSGDQLWVAIKGRAVRSADGLLTGLLGMVQDITARKQAELALSDARTRLERTLAAAEIGTTVWDIASDRVTADRNVGYLFFGERKEVDSPIATFFETVHVED
ncbi:MAG: domain S-box, partial [Verrucomicrobiaceae bacterium]|nr:domain S-box [Verrucomicrobiaceae bacterium]